MNTSFSLTSFVSGAWQTFKTHWKFIILAMLATGLVQIILQILQRGGERSGAFSSLIASVVVGFMGIIIALGWSRVLLGLNRDNAATWDTFKTDSKVWLQYLKVILWYLAYLIGYGIVAVIIPAAVGIIGLATGIKVLAIVGGAVAGVAALMVAIYFGVRYQFTNYVTLDNPQLASREIFKKTGAITKGYFWKLLGFGIVMGLINILGLICLLVGLMVTVPLTKLAAARAYDFLKNEKRSEPEVIVTETVIVEEIVE